MNSLYLLARRSATARRFFGTRSLKETRTYSTKPSVFITMPVPQAGLEMIHNKCKVTHWNSDELISRPELLSRVKGVQGIVCRLSDRIDRELLEAAGPQLKVVSTMSVGFDHIDLAACKTKGVLTGNTPGVLDDTTADLVLTLLLATARRVPEAVDAVRNNEWTANWRPLWLCGADVHHSTIGIIGLGRIGAAVARRLKGFGCKILYSGRSPKPDVAGPLEAEYVPLNELLARSDFVIPLTPLSDATRGLINKDALARMKPTAILINASRGPVVDQEALAEALKKGTIAAAGLDVTTPEPLPRDNPLFSPDIPRERLVIFPHIGSASVATRTKMAILAAENLIAGVEGRPLPYPIK